MECDQKIKPMRKPLANRLWAALEKARNQAAERAGELASLRRKVAAAEGMAEAADMCVFCCPGHCPLDAALAAWNEEGD